MKSMESNDIGKALQIDPAQRSTIYYSVQVRMLSSLSVSKLAGQYQPTLEVHCVC